MDTIHARDTRLLRSEVVNLNGLAQPMVFSAGRISAQLDEHGEYGLRLTNLTDRRIIVVLSVDRIDPRLGTRAYQGQPGLLFQPGQTRLVMKGKPSKKSPPRSLLPLKPDVGTISMLVFEEATDYPTQGMGLPPAPFGPENYRVSADGNRQWIPPANYPFRKKPGSAPEMIQLHYQVR